MKKLVCFLVMLAFASVSMAELYLINLAVPAAGTSVSFTNTWGQTVYIESGINGFAGAATANNVVGKITRTNGVIAVQAIFSTGITTNISTGFQVNRIVAIDAKEVCVITNSAASATVLSLSIKTGK